MTNYTRVALHRMNPQSVRRGDRLFANIGGNYHEALYMEGPWFFDADDHVVEIAGEAHILNQTDLYEAPLGFIQDTAVYEGDIVYERDSGHPVQLTPENLLQPDLVVKQPQFEHVGYVVLDRVYGSGPSEVYPQVMAKSLIFKRREEAERLYPDSAVVEVRWHDTRYFRPVV